MLGLDSGEAASGGRRRGGAARRRRRRARAAKKELNFELPMLAVQLQIVGVLLTPRAPPPRLVATAAPSTNSAERVCSPGTLASRLSLIHI